MIISKIKCLLKKHKWIYNNPKDEILFDENGCYIQFSRFCNNCHKKQYREIVDLGRGMIWKDTKIYSSYEFRIINLKKLVN